MIDALERIGRLSGGRRAAEYDEATLGAILYCFAVIGEAAGHVPEDVRGRHPGVAWVEMKRMRNVVVHAYFGIDPARLQATIEQDVPETLAALRRVLQDQSPEDDG